VEKGVIALHVFPSLPFKEEVAAAGLFSIHVEGKDAHAAWLHLAFNLIVAGVTSLPECTL